MAADRTADDQGRALYKAAQAGKVTAVARLLDSGAPIEWQVKDCVRGRAGQQGLYAERAGPGRSPGLLRGPCDAIVWSIRAVGIAGRRHGADCGC